jgi:hypothetical protein
MQVIAASQSPQDIVESSELIGGEFFMSVLHSHRRPSGIFG